MEIHTMPTYETLESGELVGKTAIIVNAMRANTSIITAFENGCDKVIPVNSVEDAVNTRRNFENALLCGEDYDFLMVQGFDLGNSPEEFIPISVKDRVIILCTANGTQAINSLSQADHVLICALGNVTAVAKKAMELGKPAYVICAGRQGRMSTEDMYAAGALIDRMAKLDTDTVMFDCGLLNLRTYRMYAENPDEILKGGINYETLRKIGKQSDIDYCLKEDTSTLVPVFSEGLIKI